MAAMMNFGRLRFAMYFDELDRERDRLCLRLILDLMWSMQRAVY